MGNIIGVRYCPEALASLTSPDVINDCGVGVQLYKIRRGLSGWWRCILVAHGRKIGGEARKFPYQVTRTITDCGGLRKPNCMTSRLEEDLHWSCTILCSE